MTELEERLHRAHALATFGLLAPALAHDINNLLFVLTASLELLERHPGRLSEQIPTMRRAIARTSSLNQRLLAWARRSHQVHPEPVDVCAAITELRPLCERLLGPTARLTCALDESGCHAYIGRGSLDQVLLNLVANARDAMSRRVLIAARNVAQQGDRRAVIEVTDDGHGMLAEVLSRIFEPFFTTKELGKGTGLGLNTVRSIVEQARGRIEVESRPGEGTTFRLVLPASGPPPRPDGVHRDLGHRTGRHERGRERVGRDGERTARRDRNRSGGERAGHDPRAAYRGCGRCTT
jgi:signal transduction histidine kinase